MISAAKLSTILQAYRQKFQACNFDPDWLADFIISQTFELSLKDADSPGTILEAAMLVLEKKLRSSKENCSIEIHKSATGVAILSEGFGYRGVDLNGTNPLAESLVNLAKKVSQ